MKTPKIYRVVHRPSGLFYRPCSSKSIKAGDATRYVKSNLAKTPKLYHCRPSVGMLSGSFYNHLSTETEAAERFRRDPLRSSWELVGRDKARLMLPSEWEVQSLHDGEWKPEGDLQ